MKTRMRTGGRPNRPRVTGTPCNSGQGTTETKNTKRLSSRFSESIDHDGTMVVGTASSRSEKGVSIYFQPDAEGLYQKPVGSDGDDWTAVYRIKGLKRGGKRVTVGQGWRARTSRAAAEAISLGATNRRRRTKRPKSRTLPQPGACHHRDGAGERDRDGGHVGHIRVRWTGRCGVRLPVDGRRRLHPRATGASYTLAEDGERRAGWASQTTGTMRKN